MHAETQRHFRQDARYPSSRCCAPTTTPIPTGLSKTSQDWIYRKRAAARKRFTRFGSTAVFEMNALNSPKSRAYLHRICAAFDAAGLPFTLHWGKFNAFLTAARLRTCYGNTATDEWIASREALLESPAVRDVFTNDFIANLGLAT